MLPGIGGLEYIFIAILLIIFVGPKDLPFLIRSLGRTFGKIKNLAKEFKLMINDMANEFGANETKDTVKKAQPINLTEEITNSINDTIKDNIDKQMTNSEYNDRHPNEVSHKIIGERIYNYLDKWFFHLCNSLYFGFLLS